MKRDYAHNQATVSMDDTVCVVMEGLFLFFGSSMATDVLMVHDISVKILSIK